MQWAAEVKFLFGFQFETFVASVSIVDLHAAAVDRSPRDLTLGDFARATGGLCVHAGPTTTGHGGRRRRSQGQKNFDLVYFALQLALWYLQWTLPAAVFCPQCFQIDGIECVSARKKTGKEAGLLLSCRVVVAVNTMCTYSFSRESNVAFLIRGRKR